MSKSVAIEVAGQAVAVAVPEAGGYRFVAVKYAVWDLDGEQFDSVKDAQAAATDLIAYGRLATALPAVSAARKMAVGESRFVGA